MKNKKVNSKKKGNRVENEIAKKLKEAFNEDFIRTPSSGGFHTNNKIKLTEDLAGDIITPENFNYVIEVKSRKDITFHNVLNGYLDEFIEQVENDSLSVNKLPLLIIKLNNRKPFCLIKDINSKLRYKDYSIIYLEDLLKEKKDFFFK